MSNRIFRERGREQGGGSLSRSTQHVTSVLAKKVQIDPSGSYSRALDHDLTLGTWTSYRSVLKSIDF